MPVVHLLSISVFFNIASIVPRALNKKHLKFKLMGIVNVGIQVVAGALAIFLAFEDFSYYAIVIQNILTGFLLFTIFYILYPIKLILKIRLAPLKKIASYSTYQFGYNMMNYFSRNLDSILIGKYLGNAPLGYYNKSYMLMQLPVYNLTHVVTPVLHPVLAKYQDNSDYIYKSYLRVVKILATIGFPLSIFLYFSAAPLILVMFGPQWEESVPVFEILAFSIGIQMCSSSTNAIYQAKNRTDLLFLSGSITFVLLVAGILYGIFYGGNIEYIGYGLLIAFFLNFCQDFFILISIALDKNFLSFLKIFILPLLSGGVAYLVLYFISIWEIENLFLKLVINSSVFLLVLTCFFLVSKDNREFLKGLFNNK